MSNTDRLPIAWIYEIQPPADDEWFEKASRFHPIDDEHLDEHERVEVRNIRGLVEVSDE